MKKYVLSLIQGTSLSQAFIFDKSGILVSSAGKEIEQFFPKTSLAEQDAREIWYILASVAEEAISKSGIQPEAIASIGISNQRETAIVWNKETGRPLGRAIVWHDKRTMRFCEELKAKGYQSLIKEKTGLQIDAIFSGTKLKWMLDYYEGARELAEAGKLAFGTVDSWLVWKLTKGKVHVTDVSNASRTMLFNIHELKWDNELLEIFNIPEDILPEVKSSSEVYGYTDKSLFGIKIPIAGICGDQQASLFGQMCLERGMVENTYNTGSFMLMNVGDKPVYTNNLLSTVAWKVGGHTTYALEGSAFAGGTIIQWLRDVLGLINSDKELEQLARTEADNGGVYIVPALSGLGAPYWDQHARGTFWGLNMGTTTGNIARAVIESIALSAADVLHTMEKDSGLKLSEIRVSGRLINDMLLQFQADILNVPIIQPANIETSALGSAYMAGLAVGFWDSIDEVKQHWKAARTYNAEMDNSKVFKIKKYWSKAILRSQKWLDPEDQ
ncbi:Glycerol kinase [hydrothermal vent metagenome]|uniref:glycerol kinase n=1 Tax=hydrothermal vent metagenome TaxID=652676 RepID=A0A3B0TZA7_9ZZZZ